MMGAPTSRRSPVRRRLLLTAALLLGPAVAGFGVFLWSRPDAAEPRYRGRTAKQWEREVGRWSCSKFQKRFGLFPDGELQDVWTQPPPSPVEWVMEYLGV